MYNAGGTDQDVTAETFIMLHCDANLISKADISEY